MKKDLEREKVLDQIHDLEQVLVGLGHMRAKRGIRIILDTPRSY